MIYGPYKARIVDVHDGDTIGLDIDLGFGMFATAKSLKGKSLLSCRLFGINAPELSTPAGLQARDFLETIAPLGAIVSVVSHGWDKYGGRFDGEVQMEDGTDLSEAMIAAGHAVELKS